MSYESSSHETLPRATLRSDYQPSNFTISAIDLNFALSHSATQVIACSQVTKNPATSHDASNNTLFLNGESLKLIRVEIDGKAWPDYNVQHDGLLLLNVPDNFELLIETQIAPKENTALEGLYLAGDAYCTQCEAQGFRRITYYLDRPDVQAIFTTTIIAPQSLPHLLSNGNQVASGVLDDGRHWVKWHDPFKKPCYLFALVAGDFDKLSDKFISKSGKNIALEIFVDKGNLSRAEHAMQSLKQAMAWDERRFNLEYDLDIYMIVAVDFFNMGAMENKGLNIFNSKYVLADAKTATDQDYLSIEAVIGHEYFHNWTGNRVTCRDWFQLSLKEGLTVFRDQEFSSDLGSRAVNRIANVRIIRGPQFAEDASPMAHPIRPEKVIEMNNFYTLTVYEKGSEVIRMIHTLLGEENFQKGMQLYFARHDGTAATCDDFVQAMQDASKVDLSQFRLWYSQSGTPELSVSCDYDEKKQQVTLTVSQHTPATLDQARKEALLIPLDIELYRQNGTVIPLQSNGATIANVLHVTKDKQQFVFDHVDERPVLSLLRDFSAPVKLHYDYCDSELILLMHHAKNPFSCWDASQLLLTRHIKRNIENWQAGKESDLPKEVIEAFRVTLLSHTLDNALISEIFTLPSENEIAGWYEQIDVEAIFEVRKKLRQILSDALFEPFFMLYHNHAQTQYSISHQAIGERMLRNCCLSYLALSEQGDALVKNHFATATNMTDTMAALSAANYAELTCRDELMAQFSQTWQHDGLVMDKWFSLQGTNPAGHCLTVVQKQLEHPAFSLKNPNRIRSLIGAFAQQNPLRFHASDGSGYRFLTQILTQLNESNPQVASRLIDPLLKWRKLDPARQLLMKQQLEQLEQLPNLSNDLFEKINNALNV
ncbi:MAG: aminopeptidase N [Vibrionaceae bacterium]